MTWARDVLVVQRSDGTLLYNYRSVLKFQKCCFIWTVQPTPHKKQPLLSWVSWTTSESNKSLPLKKWTVESFGESIHGDSEIEYRTFDIVLDILAFFIRQRSCRLKIKKLKQHSLKLSLFWSSSLSDLSIILFAAKFEAFSTINIKL